MKVYRHQNQFGMTGHPPQLFQRMSRHSKPDSQFEFPLRRNLRYDTIQITMFGEEKEENDSE